MKKCIIAISSVNHAIRAEKILNAKNVKSRIVKLQPEKTKKGCAYGIELACREVQYAVSFLGAAGVPYSEIVR